MSHYDSATYSAHDSIGYLMRRGASLLREQLEDSFESAGISFVQWATLMLVRDKPEITPGDLCRDLRHDSGALTRILDHLEERGLLHRARSGADRRSVQLRLTDGGQRMVETRLPLVVDRLNDVLADFSPAEVTLLTSLLSRMILRLERTDAAPVAATRVRS